MARGTVQIDTDRCKGCELCVNACPQHVLHLSATYNTRGYRPVTLDEVSGACTGCAICALVCPDMAFTVYRAPVHQRRAA